MDKDKIRYELKKKDGEVIQIGCTDKDIHSLLYHYCKRNQRLLITYTITEQDKLNAGLTFGTYHYIRDYDQNRMNTFNDTQTIIYNNG
jgi:hypothetical protein